MRGGLVAAVVLGLGATSAEAGLFDGLFAPAERSAIDAEEPPLLGPRTDAGVCVAAIRQAEAAEGIPDDLLLAIGLQEAGIGYRDGMTVWPWTLNVEGQGFRFDTRAEAEAFLADELAKGKRSIDVGCLQINLRWHPHAFPSPQAGFDPERNARYAAQFLRGLYLETGDWREAAGRYHSASEDLKDGYLANVERHLTRLDGDAGAIDALASESVAAPSLAGGVTLAASLERRMNPLRAPVRPRGTASEARGSFRRTLMPLPAGAGGGDEESLP